ncbi:MAG TPA: glycoside hydrolase family 3 C-terminal domain-containing protein [Candidatus Gemmiger stercoripullorum]|nr:glycoside hydrolase family 3 C-terminal domain-containing protein [Candidatus Gemmiger stercoripullorum]
MIREEKTAEYRKRAAELVSKMTLKEKISQMLSWAPAIERLGIPAYNWWSEGIHGVGRAGTATVFPQAIGMAAAFDPDMMHKVGETVGVEARGKYNMCRSYGDRDIYKGLTVWAPNINIFRDPRWGRGHETYGEDPYLTSRLGVNFVEGMQGDDPDYLQAAACAKHFAVHSGPEDQRHYFNAEVNQQDLWETYLPAFRALVEEAGVEAVMGAYNRTNGEPCCGSKTLLKDILRGKWHFQGHVTSDCWAIKDFHEGHMVTDGPVDSVSLAVNNGCDLNCGNLYVYLEQAVAEGKVKEETIDECVTHLFTTRFKLGMFDEDDKVPYNKLGHDAVDTAASKAFNLEVAEKILVLLKNKDNILPLDKTKLKSIAVVGPNADSRKALVGNYEGTASRYFTVLDGLHEYLGDDVQIRYSEGCHLYADKLNGLAQEGELISEVKGVCAESDVVICCLGLDSGLEGEEGDQGNQFASGDKPNLNLPGHQEEILRVCLDSGKPVIVVVLSGSALAINTAENEAAAVLQAWYPGAMGGLAVARALFGEVNPQGKLPVTFYHSDADLPSFTDYAMKGRTYRYIETEPLYPFGYGLSYTRFTFNDAAVSAGTAGPDGVDVSVTVRNEGSRAGTETVEVYVKAERPGTPNAQLKGLAKVSLQPGEEQRVTVHLPLAALALCDEAGVSQVLPGDYTLWVGGSQPDTRSITLTGQAPARLALHQTEKVVMDE